ncbi:major facilitator superfamily domain-containing protein [Lactifluus volemus]|nr:major facilitator superfamily domain-containing protein [Lactifluus volemus]
MQREPNDHRDGISKSASPLAGDGAVRQLAEDRTEALMRIDEAPFSWSHLKACLIAGIGFFTEAYDVFAINQASLMLGHVYGHTIDTFGRRQLSTNQDFGIKVVPLVGNLLGQLLFGWLGWKSIYGIELIIIITATFAQALVGADPVVGVIVIYRFIMGVGIGGGHPLSAVTTSKFASRHIRGRLTKAVFTSQGWGIFEPNHVDYCWRILIGLGCIPGTLALNSKFTMDIDRVVQRAKDDIDSVLTEGANHWVDPDAVGQRVQWRNFWRLFGVAYSWFAIEWLRNVAVGSLIVSVAGLLPGYYATIFLIDRWGRKQLQFLCFSMLTIVLVSLVLCIARIYPSDNPGPNLQNKPEAFVALYCLANFFANFGSNLTAFIVLGELFPTRYHSTICGIFAQVGSSVPSCRR